MNLTMLQKYCDRTVQDFPFLVMLLLTAGAAVSLATGAVWPLVWAFASVAIKFMDVRLIKQALRQADPEQATHTSFKANWFGIAFIYAYATLPTALLMTFRFELVMGGMALLIAGASRSVMMFSVSRNLGIAYYAPYFLVPAVALAGDILFSHDHSITGHLIGIGALLCCLLYIWKAWHRRYAFEQTLTQLRASAETQRDAAARDAAVSRLLFQQTSLRAALLDTNGAFIAANPSWVKAISKSETEILGQSFEVAMPFVAAHWRDAVRQALSGTPVQAKADKFTLPDGSSLYLDWDVQPWHTHDGAIGGVVVYAQDITEDMAHQEKIAALIARAKVALGQKRKMLEELCGQTAIPQDGAPETAQAPLTPAKSHPSSVSQPTDNASFGQLFSGLEQILSEIDDRDVALAAAVQQLRDARAAAEAANLAKSQFLANMSHELRTPLNAIIGYTEILIEDAEFDQRQDAANDASKVRNSATHLLGLINEILDLSKIEAG
ncbi:MAG: Autoinducer 2 sensor kinase/phosphatase LuxQ, partial [Pseudomonadota bacterium]